MQPTATVKKSLLHIDPRTKFFLLFFVGFFTFCFPPVYMEVGMITGLSVILILNRQPRIAITAFIVFSIMLSMHIYLLPFIPAVIHNVFLTVVLLVRIMIPLYLVGILLIRTTTVTEFISAFRKMHLPEAFIIPFSVMFRFMPTISEEWSCIRNAMRFRGIGASPKNVLTKPMATLEYMLIPLLMSTATIAGELAAASLARGLDSDGERTCIVSVKFRLTDYLLVLVCTAIIIWWVVYGK